MKKILSYVLAIAVIMTSLCLPVFNTGVLNAEASFGEIPEIGKINYSDDFSGSVFSSRVVEKNGTVSLSSGELTISHVSADSAWSGVVFSLNEDKTPVAKGNFGVSFKLKRADLSHRVCVRGKSSGNRDYFGFDWGNGYTAAFYSDTKGINGDAHKLNGFGNENEILVTAYYNIDNQTYSLWLDDTLMIKDKYARVTDASDMAQIRIYTEIDGAKIAIDDFIYYNAKESIALKNKITHYADDFSGSSLSSRIVEKNGNVALSSGELTINLDSADSGWAGAVFSLNEDKTPVAKGNFGVSFKLKRADLSHRVCVRGKSSGNRDYFGFDWGKGYAAAYYSDTKGINGDAHKLNGFGNENEILVTVYYNIDNQTYSLWLDDTLMIKDKYARFTDASDMAQIRIYTEVVGGGFAIDDFIYYNDIAALVEYISENSLLIVASYCGNKMQDVKLIPVSSNCTITMVSTGLSLANTDTIRAFLWKDTSGLVPLCVSDDISCNNND